MFSLKSLNQKRVFILSIILIFTFGKAETTFKYYEEEQSSIRIDVIDIRFKKLGFNLTENDTLFLSIIPNGDKGDITWAPQSENKKKTQFLKYFSYLNFLKFFPKKNNIKLKGKSKNKFSRPVTYKNRPNLLALPVKGKTIDKRDWLKLNKVVLELNGVGRSRLKASLNKDAEKWMDLGYEFIVSSFDSISTDWDYLFTEKSFTDSISFKVKIELNESSFMSPEYGMKLVIKNNDGADGKWFSEYFSFISTAIDNSPNKKFTVNFLSEDTLLWFPNEKMSGAHLIEINDLPILNQSGIGNINIEYLGITSDPEGHNNFAKKQPIIDSLVNVIHWQKFELSLLERNDRLFIREDGNYGPFQIQIDGEKGINAIKVKKDLILSLDQKGVATWGDLGNNTILNGFDHRIENSGKDIRFTRNRNRLGQVKVIKNLSINLNKLNSSEINMTWHTDIFNNNKLNLITQQIIIAKPTINLANDSYIFNNDFRPELGTLVLGEDEKVSSLRPGDKIIYELPSNLKFDSNFLNKINIKPEVLSIKPNPDNESLIVFILKRRLKPGENIIINNLPIKKIRDASKSFSDAGNYYFNSNRLTPSSSKKVEDKYEIHISNVQFSMQESKEFVQDVQKSDDAFSLPPVNIHNGSSSGIFHNETIIIDLKTNTEYKFDISSLQIGVPSGLSIRSKSLSENEKKIILTLNGFLDASETIYLNKIKLKTTSKSNYFYQAPLRLALKINERTIHWETGYVISYGAPLFRSLLEQVIYPNHPTSELYLFEVDLTKFPITLKTLNSITLSMPENVKLSWDSKTELQFDGKGGHFLEKKYRLSNNNKLLTIYIDHTLAQSPKSAQFLIGGSMFTDIQSYKKPKKFSIKLSLNNGKTFCTEDATPKWIVSSAHRAYIDRQRIQESYFPFQKNNLITFVITDKSTKAVWDKNKIKITPKNRKLKSEAFDINNPTFSKDAKNMSIKILKDVYGDYRQKMDFGDKIEFQGIHTLGQCSMKDISLVVQTPYGFKSYVDTKDMLTFGKKQVKNNEFELIVGLKDFENANDDLGKPFLRNWYWFPDRDLQRLNINNDTPLGSDRLKKEVKGVLQKLVKLKNIKGDDINHDWAYWYYLAWAKKRADEQNFLNRLLSDIRDPSMKKPYTSDMNKARNAGYHSGLNSTFPIPGTSYDIIAERQKEFEKAYALFLKDKYIESETLVLNSLLKDGVENYIRSAFYCLLGQIGASLNDTEPIEQGFGKNEIVTTYPLLICNYATEYISDPNDRRNLEQWQPEIYEFLTDYEINIKAKYPERIQYEKLEIHETKKKERLVESSSNIIFSWQPAQVASTLKWEYSLRSPKYFLNSDDEYALKLKKTVAKHSSFGDTIEVHGGGKYKFKFNTKKSILKYYGASALAGLLAYVWIS
jgi:hypothetical protein